MFKMISGTAYVSERLLYLSCDSHLISVLTADIKLIRRVLTVCSWYRLLDCVQPTNRMRS